MYSDFLKTKEINLQSCGFSISLTELNPALFDWQMVIVKWALARGKAALFEGCGLGKTIQQLEWANQINKKTEKPVLILAPLAVSEQTVQEGGKFDISVNICSDSTDVVNGINITNYEKLHKFDCSVFSGVVLDESSLIKNFSGIRRNQILDSFKHTHYKLACTATPSPNDYMELGNHSEFLNIMTRVEMLSMFFINDANDIGNWRLKGHVRDNIFWKWLSTWAVMITKPSDIGFDDNGFILPEIYYHEHIINSTAKPKIGLLLQEAGDLNERRKVRKDTINIRGDAAANIINKDNDYWVVWCNLNAEGDYLEKVVNAAIQVAGKDSDDTKSDRMNKFAKGKIRRIVTKPKIAGLGMNWQICNKAAFIGLSDSWEQFFQAVRRIWRFGQYRSVDIHIFLEQREGSVLKNIKNKDRQAQIMIANMLTYMKDLTKAELSASQRESEFYFVEKLMELPKWINC